MNFSDRIKKDAADQAEESKGGRVYFDGCNEPPAKKLKISEILQATLEAAEVTAIILLEDGLVDEDHAATFVEMNMRTMSRACELLFHVKIDFETRPISKADKEIRELARKKGAIAIISKFEEEGEKDYEG